MDLHPGIAIGAQVVERALREMPAGSTLEETCETAMRECRKDTACWLCSTDDMIFKVAVGGLLLFYRNDYDAKARIEYELRLLGSFSAAQSGVPVDFGAFMSDDAPKPLGLLRMFHAAKGG